tara:strand:+ start:10185 stop:10589 length:405 start_codon:yes stop_codon:yes gene_type:complete
MKPNISPHVSIYKFPLTALSSITNRITGVVLSGGFVIIGISSFFPKQQTTILQKYESFKQYESMRIIKPILFFPIIFHTLGGIRHFLWDFKPQLLSNSKVTKSSFILFGTTGIFYAILELIDKNSYYFQNKNDT